MDPLSDLISLLRPHAALSKPITGRGRWGVRYASDGRLGFGLILAGQCWLEIAGAKPVLLSRGDFVLLPSTPAFAMFSQPGVRCVLREPSGQPVRHGDPDGDPDFQMFGGAFQIDRVNAPLLLALLPQMIHIRAEDGIASRLARINDLIREECAADNPGREMILQRLLEVMLVECLRSRRIGENTVSAGLLAGLRDPALAAALRAIHADVRHGWSVAELARLAGMSRSAFAARFGKTVGCAPMEYISRWRMALAKDALSRGGQPLDRLADDIGFESERIQHRVSAASWMCAGSFRADIAERRGGGMLSCVALLLAGTDNKKGRPMRRPFGFRK